MGEIRFLLKYKNDPMTGMLRSFSEVLVLYKMSN